MTASIQTLLDENGNQVLPRTRTEAITTPDGTTWQDVIDSKADKPRALNLVLLASGWTGSVAPYTQTVAAAGVTGSANGIISISNAATDEQWLEAQEADIRVSGQGTNTITLKAYGEKPTADIPASIILMG